jgi:predicted peptidase
MGGMGTFEMVRRNPKLFAAAFPICGGANVATAPALKKTKWWVFHGGKDDVVPPKLSQDMVDAMKKEKATVKFTLYPNANHNSWTPAFAEPDLLYWLFAQKK